MSRRALIATVPIQVVAVPLIVGAILYAVPSTRRAILGGYYSGRLASLVTHTIQSSHVADITGVTTSCAAVKGSDQYACLAHISTVVASLSFTEQWIGTVSGFGEFRVHRIGRPVEAGGLPGVRRAGLATPTIYAGMACPDWLHQPASAQRAYITTGTNPPVSATVARLAVQTASSECIDRLDGYIPTAAAMVSTAERDQSG